MNDINFFSISSSPYFLSSTTGFTPFTPEATTPCDPEPLPPLPVASDQPSPIKKTMIKKINFLSHPPLPLEELSLQKKTTNNKKRKYSEIPGALSNDIILRNYAMSMQIFYQNIQNVQLLSQTYLGLPQQISHVPQSYFEMSLRNQIISLQKANWYLQQECLHLNPLLLPVRAPTT